MWVKNAGIHQYSLSQRVSAAPTGIAWHVCTLGTLSRPLALHDTSARLVHCRIHWHCLECLHTWCTITSLGTAYLHTWYAITTIGIAWQSAHLVLYCMFKSEATVKSRNDASWARLPETPPINYAFDSELLLVHCI